MTKTKIALLVVGGVILAAYAGSAGDPPPWALAGVIFLGAIINQGFRDVLIAIRELRGEVRELASRLDDLRRRD